MTLSKKKILVLLFIGFLMTFTIPSKGGNPFVDEVTTESGYPTWDSDMVNVEQVTETGQNVYIAVLDTGLAPNWEDYFPEERIATEYGIGFQEALRWDRELNDFVYTTEEVHTTTFFGSRGTCHGTHVTSTIIGYFYDTMVDESFGYNVPPIMVRGIAPNVKIIPVKVLTDYQIPGYEDDEGNRIPAQNVVFGTDRMVAAGIQYIADLAPTLDGPVIISMSLGGPLPDDYSETAIANAIANGVIVVASAGNEGSAGMGWPGAYPEVISVGAVGWRYEWWWPGLPDDEGNGPDPDEFGYVNSYSPELDQRNRQWWLQSIYNDYIDLVEGADLANNVYVTDFSSREIPDHPEGPQELDVLAPGSWVRGPYPGTPGYSHLPWWSNSWGAVRGWNPGNFYYVGGTSMSAPHVSGIAALMLEADPTLTQAEIESIMKSTALQIQPGNMDIVDTIYDGDVFLGWGWRNVEWDSDATGAGLIQADLAVAAASA